MAPSSLPVSGPPEQLSRSAGGWLTGAAAIPAHDTTSVRALEARAIAQDVSAWHLMRRAAEAAWQVMRARWHDTRSVTVLCGSGNNGGDGRVLASLAARNGWQVRLVECGGKADSPMAVQSHRLVQETDVEVLTPEQWLASTASNAAEEAPSDGKPSGDALLVDALLGTGLQGAVRPKTALLLLRMSETGLPILALDIPSGLDANTGQALGPVARATATITFIAAKPGLLTGEGREFCGAIHLATLGLPDAWLMQPGNEGRCYPLLLSRQLHRTLPTALHRRADAHKSQLGRILIAGGDEGMGGAALLAAETALRSGAGLVTAAVSPAAVPGFLARCPEIMAHGIANGQDLEPLLQQADVVVLGPGLGQGARAEQFVQQTLAATAAGDCRLIVDAGALRLLTPGNLWRKRLPPGAVLTPHVGEAAALLGCSSDEVAADRFAAVRTLAAQTGCTVALKGSGTLVAASADVGEDAVCLCPSGNAGMATAGTGDVLAGLIGALLGRGLTSDDATRLGVAVHAEAGDRAALLCGEAGLTASALIPHLSGLIEGVSCA